jgi:hypothetical protein
MMRRLALAALALVLWCSGALAQSSCTIGGINIFAPGVIPTPGQWAQCLESKQDFLGSSALAVTNVFGTAPITVNVAGTIVTIGISNGVSVVNPGTGTLETVFPIQTVAGASKTFATADLFKETRRSNSGSAMTDTFPAATVTGIVSGTRITVTNVDATATDTITAGSGTTISGNATYAVGPGRAVQFAYDLANTEWRPTLNTGDALLGPNNLNDVSNRATALANLMPTPTRAGDIVYWNGSNWVTLAGNNSGTQCLVENSSGSPTWTNCGPAGSSGQVQTNSGSGSFAALTNTQLTALINVATASLSGALPAWPNTTTTYFRGDGTYQTLNPTAVGALAISNNLSDVASKTTAQNNLFPSPTRAGDIVYWNGSNWVTLAGNNSGTQCLVENSSGSPTWTNCGWAINAVQTYGAVGDDNTDNTAAMTSAINQVNSVGGFVAWPEGSYRYNCASTPAITATGGGFIGVGSGSAYTSQNTGPSGAAHGTIFRCTSATANSLTTGGSIGFAIRDIGFWPVPFKTGGFEIQDGGTNTIIDNVSCSYVNGCIFFGGGSNGSSARHTRCFGVFGSTGCVMTQGSSSAIANWAQGILVDDIIAYNPWPVSEPGQTASINASWTAGATYATGAIVINGNYVFQAITGGVAAASGGGPVPPSYSFAGAPTTTGITDNTVVWHMTEAAQAGAVNVDSNSVNITISNAQLLTFFWGLIVENTLSSSQYPQDVTISLYLVDSTLGDSIFAPAGSRLSILDGRMHESAIGRGFTGGAGFTGGLLIRGNHVWKAALNGIQLPPITNCICTVVDNVIAGNGAKTSNTYAGILIGSSTTKVTARGNTIGPDAAGGGTQSYGMTIDAGSDSLEIDHNNLCGNGTGGMLNGATTVNSVIVDNLCYNPVGVTAAANVGTSPATITNGATPATHYLNQSATNTATVAKGGRAVATLAGSSTYYPIQLGPNESYTVTWSTTQPTYTADVHLRDDAFAARMLDVANDNEEIFYKAARRSNGR